VFLTVEVIIWLIFDFFVVPATPYPFVLFVAPREPFPSLPCSSAGKLASLRMAYGFPKTTPSGKAGDQFWKARNCQRISPRLPALEEGFSKGSHVHGSWKAPGGCGMKSSRRRTATQGTQKQDSRR
jgi:hypothetical protein